MGESVWTAGQVWDLRRAKPSEAGALLFMLKEVAEDLRSRGIRQWERFLEGGEAVVERRFREGTVYLCGLDGQDAASLVLQDMDAFWDGLGLEGSALWAHTLAVRPRFRGLGLGAALLGYAHAAAKAGGKRALRLDVLDDNPKLKAYYESLGFVPGPAKAWEERSVRLFEKPC